MGRKTQDKMKHNRMIAIKDIPNAVEGWYKASRTFPKKILMYRKRLGDFYKLYAVAKKQMAMDSLFKEYVRKHDKSLYWEAVHFMEELDLKTAKEFGKAIGELKVGPFVPEKVDFKKSTEKEVKWSK
jgi:hypothetical protein